MKTWLVLDCDYLCHRALYTTGGLSHRNFPTGVIYGFLRDIVTFQSLMNTHRIVFCFDHGKPLRSVDCPTYKCSRHSKRTAPLELEAYNNYRMQVRDLRLRILDRLGFANILYQKGYEADDMIAAVCSVIPQKHRVIVVSADSDLFQLLSDRVSCYNPHKKRLTTVSSFAEEFIDPTFWVDVKSIAGCSTDDIPGVQGVGEKTAIKFLTGRLKTTSPLFHAIVKGQPIWRKNKHLVRLPYPGVKDFTLYRDECTIAKWREVASEFGMRSLLREAPLSARHHG
jgi:DNA polymerase-1